MSGTSPAWNSIKDISRYLREIQPLECGEAIMAGDVLSLSSTPDPLIWAVESMEGRR